MGTHCGVCLQWEAAQGLQSHWHKLPKGLVCPVSLLFQVAHVDPSQQPTHLLLQAKITVLPPTSLWWSHQQWMVWWSHVPATTQELLQLPLLGMQQYQSLVSHGVYLIMLEPSLSQVYTSLAQVFIVLICNSR